MSHNFASLNTLVLERIDEWSAGATPDAAGLVQEHPELRDAKSLVMHLVLTEYELKKMAGAVPAVDALCDRFPEYRQSIAKLLEVQAGLDTFPGFAASRDETRWPHPGDEFLGFKLIEPLGVGGLARVFLAREPAVGNRFVVVKISPLGGSEAHTLGKLSHPSIVPIHSVKHDKEHDWTVICMPLLGVATGVDLLDRAFAKYAGRRDASLIRRVARETIPLEPVPLPETSEVSRQDKLYEEGLATLGLQLAEALDAAHAAGIMHRDLKPSNVLLAWSGRAMLLDFNLSTDVAAQVAGVGGTLAYMPPERIMALRDKDAIAARDFEPPSDIYSLGVVLYELLTGQLPAKPENAERLPLDAYGPWLACKEQPIVAPSTLQPSIDARLEAIVLKCLAHDAAKRYATAAELSAALRTYLGQPARIGRFVKRNRRALLLTAAAALSSAVGLGVYVGSRPSEWELLYQQGLDEYEAEKFDAAAATFSKCLRMDSSSPRALFGRAQALRRAEKFSEARTDYASLKETDPIWSAVFKGYCSMKLQDHSAANADFGSAYKKGLRDTDFLFNYARTDLTRFWYSGAIEKYNEIIAKEPANKQAHHQLVMAHFNYVRNDMKRLPSPQALEAARAYCELDQTSFDPAACAAVLFGDAARKNHDFDEQAIRYLRDALCKGAPYELLTIYEIQFKRLEPAIGDEIRLAAKRDPKWLLNPIQVREPPTVADWFAFQVQVSTQQAAITGGH